MGGPGRRGICAAAVALALAGAALVGARAPISGGGEREAPLALVLAEPGRSLRSAVEALARGEGELADALLEAIAKRHPIIADHAELLRLRARVEAGDAEGAIALEPGWTGRDGPLRGRAYALLGDAYRTRGDERRARSAWEFAAAGTRDRERLAALALAAADSQLREAEARPARRDAARQAAAERLLEVWTRYAELDAARAAEERLVALERALGRELRSARHATRRADELFRRYHNEAALAAYDHALEQGLPSDVRRHARHQRAETLFRLRRYPEAIEAFGALPPSDERRIQIARAQARTGRVAQGARALQELGETTRGSDAVNALYLAGLLWDGEGERERAQELFRAVIRRAPRSSYASAGRWWLGWEAFRAGRYADAAEHFEGLARRESDPVAALRPRYWRVRALEAAGDPEAPAHYAELAREYPFSYYGWRALERSGRAVEPRPAPVLGSGRRGLSSEQLERPRILLEAGLVEEARDELTWLFARARGVEDRVALAALYEEAGDFHHAQRVVVDAYAETLARGPAPAHLELWWHAWPAPWEDELREATRSGRPPPELVYAIMREESGYRPEVISVSGARGLLQLMPETATRVARAVARAPFDPDDLFRPEVNIELGSAYLGQLLDRFDGNTPAAIGSYNAGPEAVARWLRGEPAPEDVWVEEVPYTQTRAYLKRVLRSLHAYRVLY